MKTTAFAALTLFALALAPSVFAASQMPSATALTTAGNPAPVEQLLAEQSSGGWGVDCQTNRLNCTSSGRQLGCQATIGNAANRSECVAHWGDQGWVACRVYDPSGAVLASFTDECP